ncbi:hypothetical protein M0R04_04135 [Candidatus Dojkabacteria bacterium]|jgi:hypothetical protein|nr:hypothetical protein [Candidatus Dojkabacteria bacterium]
MANRIRIAELDFDQIKNNLKAFLKQQDTFTDYDFEGSGLNILLDILAYNTHYQAYYLNMVANESFLDTALLRDSVVSHAKSLGYTPFSKKSSNAFINFEVRSNSNEVGTLTIPRGFSFLSNQIDGKSYKFIVLDDTTVTKSNTSYYFENLKINEGQLLNYSYGFDQSSNPKQIFTLLDENIDTDTLMVSVSPSVGNTSITFFNKAVDVTDVTANSNVFFIQEQKNGKYQIYFGDNVIGRKVPDGGVVYVNYLATNSTGANKANNFIATNTLSDSLNESLTNFVISPVLAATGGSDRESVDSIKYSAPLSYVSQNRLVTYNDYENHIRKSYPNIDSISVWGGEREDPPIYGKVFISLKPKQNYYISEAEKDSIINEIVDPKSMVTVRSEIRDPEFLNILVNINVQYDPSRTSLTKESLKNTVRNAIIIYNNNYLNKFSSKFVLSKLQEEVNSVDLNSVIGCESYIKVQKRIVPNLGVIDNYTVNFNVPLSQRTLNNKLSSSEFEVYDNSGVLRNVILEEVPNSYTGINSISVIDPGSSYTSTPTVTITGDGIGATAIAIINKGKIEKIQVLTTGIDYNRAVVTISGGGGFGAIAVPIIDTKVGILRTIYYSATAERRIVNNNVGTINYDEGTIQLNDLNIVSTKTLDGLIKIECPTQTGIIQSSRNSILVIDESDPYSIIINLQEI